MVGSMKKRSVITDWSTIRMDLLTVFFFFPSFFPDKYGSQNKDQSYPEKGQNQNHLLISFSKEINIILNKPKRENK